MRRQLALVLILILMGTAHGWASVFKSYYPDGTVKYIAHYNSKKQLNGPYTYYWPNGQIKERGRYKNGEQIAPIRKYSPDGVLLGN